MDAAPSAPRREAPTPTTRPDGPPGGRSRWSLVVITLLALAAPAGAQTQTFQGTATWTAEVTGSTANWSGRSEVRLITAPNEFRLLAYYPPGGPTTNSAISIRVLDYDGVKTYTVGGPNVAFYRFSTSAICGTDPVLTPPPPLGSIQITMADTESGVFAGNFDFQVRCESPSRLRRVTGTFSVGLIVVNSTGDEPDLNPADALCDVDPAPAITRCTLRAAIQESNARPLRQGIGFAITNPDGSPFVGLPVIYPASALPSITDPVVIDASGQPGGFVEVSGLNAGEADGLRTTSTDNVSVRRLMVNRFAGAGLRLTGGQGHRVEDSRFGFDQAGTELRLNAGGGVLVESGATDVTIGTDVPNGPLNYIAGGVVITGATTRGIRVLRNVLEVPAEWLSGAALRTPVDLGTGTEADGPTCVPWAEGATGPNGLMAPPRILSLSTTEVAGQTRPSATVVVYRATQSGTDVGRYWARRVEPVATVEADAMGAFSAAIALPPGALVTATATDALGNTSELAQLKRPVVYIPGVGGSWLREKSNNEAIWLPLGFTDIEKNRRLTRMAMNPDGKEDTVPLRVDGILEFNELELVYGDVLEEIQDAGYPGDRTNTGRATNDLWRFANDWRKSSVILAKDLRLLVNELTGGATDVATSCEVDLVTHSNGGLIASVYVRSNPEAAADRVHRLLTSGTPYLGAPQAAAAHTRGYIFGVDEKFPFSVAWDVAWGQMTAMTRNVPVAYGLMPSRAYWEAADPTKPGHKLGYILEDFDRTPLRSYDATFAFLTRPKTDAETKAPLGFDRNGEIWEEQQRDVHALIDDWRTYDRPPQIFRQVGRLPAATATAWFLTPLSDLLLKGIPEGGTTRSESDDDDRHRAYRELLRPDLGWGDGTVPLVSATLGWDKNVGRLDLSGVNESTWIEPFRFYECKHVDLVDPGCEGAGESLSAVDRTVEVLRSGYEVPTPEAAAATTRSGRAAAGSAAGRELLYVSSTGPAVVHLTDAAGQHTGPVSPGEPRRIEHGVPNVGYWPTEYGATLSLPTGAAYTVTVEPLAGSTVRAYRLLVSGDDTSRRNALFSDQPVAAGGSLRFRLAAAGTPETAPFEIDADGDGTYEASAGPAAVVTSSGGIPAIPAPQPGIVSVATDTTDLTVPLTLPDVGGPAFTWTLDEDAPWLTASATTGTTPASIDLTLSPAGLAPGLYNTTASVALSIGGYAVTVPVPVEFRVGTAGSTAAEGTGLPAEFGLAGPFPNPTSAGVRLQYQLPVAAEVEVGVYDLLGRRVLHASPGTQEAGYHTVDLSTEALASGVYAVRANIRPATGTAVVFTRRLTVVR